MTDPAYRIGVGMVPMDVFVVGALWCTAAFSVYVSVALGTRERPRAKVMRWVMTLGTALLAATLTVRLVDLGDLPMSPQYALGLMLHCVGYVGLALERMRKDVAP